MQLVSSRACRAGPGIPAEVYCGPQLGLSRLLKLEINHVVKHRPMSEQMAQ